jgi:nucleoid DNA-binding protein
MNRRDVLAVLNTALHAVRDSLGEQVRQGVRYPSVKIRHVGVFEMRLYQPTRRPHLNGTVRVIPARWRVAFRPADRWNEVMSSWPTRTTSQEAPKGTSLETPAWPTSFAADEETRRSDLPDV